MAKRARIVKVFCEREEQRELRGRYEAIESYASFALLRVDPAQARALARRFPLEDITAQYALRVAGRAIDTSRPRVDRDGRTRPHPAYRGVPRLAPGRHHYLVQLTGPIKRAWLARLRRAGAEPRAPYADFAYVVRCDSRHLAEVASLPMVRWLGHLPHRARIEMAPEGEALPRTRSLAGVYRVEFFDARDLRRGAARVRSLGFRILARDEAARVLTVRAEGRAAQLERLSAVHGVRAIRRRALKRPSNDVAAGLMNARAALARAAGLSGRGEIIAICDTGLDTGRAATIHPDFRGRIAAIRSYPIPPDLSAYVHNPGADDGPSDVDSGHGTHVAGSALGAGSESLALPGQRAPIRGLAHAARLVFQAVEQELDWKSWADEQLYGRYLLVGIPEDLEALFAFAWRKGARIHSNSWGGGDPGEYDAQCRQLDEFVWKRKDFCVLVAAGNDGSDADGDGRINPMSVTSPATAKNCIAVGACESRRRQFDAETYGGWWAKDYPAAPFRDDPMADDPRQVVAFSSRGPTRDGRVKPEVVAPGTFILSTRSRRIAASNHAWGAFPKSRAYFYMGGTSMATPLAAGAVALLREHLRVRVGYRSPSAALLKAALVAGARRLPGAGAGSAPDHAQGFGRVDVDAIAAPRRPAAVYFVDESNGLETGQSDTLELRVRSSRAPLCAALAYSDYPGPSLVNNLNLVLTDPRGRSYVGNGARGGSLESDARNNAERVHVARPRAGRWRLRVIGSNVPHGPQDYALCLRGPVSSLRRLE